MFARITQVFNRHRLPLPERYRLPSRYAPAVFISTLLIVTGVLSLIIATHLGTELFTRSSTKPPVGLSNDSAQLISEMRASSYAEVAAMETSMFRLSLDILQQATSQSQREVALRHAKQARESAVRHLDEALTITLLGGTYPGITELRARLDDLDREMASIPGSGSN